MFESMCEGDIVSVETVEHGKEENSTLSEVKDVTCTNMCSGHGDCVKGVCQCDKGW